MFAQARSSASLRLRTGSVGTRKRGSHPSYKALCGVEPNFPRIGSLRSLLRSSDYWPPARLHDGRHTARRHTARPILRMVGAIRPTPHGGKLHNLRTILFTHGAICILLQSFHAACEADLDPFTSTDQGEGLGHDSSDRF